MQDHDFDRPSARSETYAQETHGSPALDFQISHLDVATEMQAILEGQVEDGNALITRVMQTGSEHLTEVAQKVFDAYVQITKSVSLVPTLLSEALFVSARVIEERGNPDAALLLDQVIADHAELLPSSSDKLRAYYHMVQSLQVPSSAHRASGYETKMREVVEREEDFTFETLPILNAICIGELPNIREAFLQSGEESYLVQAAEHIMHTLRQPRYNQPFHREHDIALYAMGTVARVYATLEEFGYSKSLEAEEAYTELEDRALSAEPGYASAQKLLQCGRHYANRSQFSHVEFLFEQAMNAAREELHQDTAELIESIDSERTRLRRGF